jgi:hypothetical protein
MTPITQNSIEHGGPGAPTSPDSKRDDVQRATAWMAALLPSGSGALSRFLYDLFRGPAPHALSVVRQKPHPRALPLYRCSRDPQAQDNEI